MVTSVRITRTTLQASTLRPLHPLPGATQAPHIHSSAPQACLLTC